MTIFNMVAMIVRIEFKNNSVLPSTGQVKYQKPNTWSWSTEIMVNWEYFEGYNIRLCMKHNSKRKK